MKRLEITYEKDTLYIESYPKNNQPETYFWRKCWISGEKEKTCFKHLGKKINSFARERSSDCHKKFGS